MTCKGCVKGGENSYGETSLDTVRVVQTSSSIVYEYIQKQNLSFIQYDPELSSRQFGVELSRLTSEDRAVPLVVEKLINYIEMHGLYTEGIYRKSGSTNKIKELRQGLDTGKIVCPESRCNTYFKSYFTFIFCFSKCRARTFWGISLPFLSLWLYLVNSSNMYQQYQLQKVCQVLEKDLNLFNRLIRSCYP